MYFEIVPPCLKSELLNVLALETFLHFCCSCASQKNKLGSLSFPTETERPCLRLLGCWKYASRCFSKTVVHSFVMNCILLTNFMSRITFLWRMQAAREQNVALCVWLSRRVSRTRSLSLYPSPALGCTRRGRLRDSGFPPAFPWSLPWLTQFKACVPSDGGVHCGPAAARCGLDILASYGGDRDQMCLKVNSSRDSFFAPQGSPHVLSSLPFCSSNSAAGKALRCKCTGQGPIVWVPFLQLAVGLI